MIKRGNDGYYMDPRVAADYDAECSLHAVTVDDIPFYVELARRAAVEGREVLELGCGTGRVTLPIAAAGVSITGIDSSPGMLAVARDRSPSADNPRWLLADMTSFDLDQRFGLVIIPFRSFQQLLTRAQQRDCLASIGRHLLPGGRLALNLANPAPLLPAGRPSATADGDDGAIVSRLTRGLSLRYVFREEMEQLLAEAGLEVEAVSGWFDGRPLTGESSEQIWCARKILPNVNRQP